VAAGGKKVDDISTIFRPRPTVLFGALAALLVLLAALVVWPRSENRDGVATSDTSTRVERKAPVDKPKTDLSTPAPTKPAQ
jgi:hypothetical protein